MKGVAILTVVYIHSSSASNVVDKYFTSFHMFLFFFLSGYCFKKEKTELNYSLFVGEKNKTIIIPYFLFCGTNTYICYFFGKLTSFDEVIINLFSSNNLFGAVWFLLSLYFVMNLSYFIIKYINDSCSILLTGVLSLLISVNIPLSSMSDFFRVPQALVGLFFFLVGYTISTKDILITHD